MDTRLDKKQTIERWGIRFTGIVQGVGFRPLVSMWAHQLGISGFVYNDSSGVYVEAQSDIDTLQLFVDTIQEEQPRLCRITHVSITKIDPSVNDDDKEFVIILTDGVKIKTNRIEENDEINKEKQNKRYLIAQQLYFNMSKERKIDYIDLRFNDYIIKYLGDNK